MGRKILSILAVIAISAALSRVDLARGQREADAEWVRTSRGWESRSVLAAPSPPVSPALHPSLVAGFQLATSLFFLLALPTQVQRRTLAVRSAAPSAPIAS